MIQCTIGWTFPLAGFDLAIDLVPVGLGVELGDALKTGVQFPVNLANRPCNAANGGKNSSLKK